MVHRRSEFRASKIMVDRALANPKIKPIMPAVVEEVHDVAQGVVTAVTLRNVETGETWKRDVDGLFIAIGHRPNTAVFKGQIEPDERRGSVPRR